MAVDIARDKITGFAKPHRVMAKSTSMASGLGREDGGSSSILREATGSYN